MTSTKIFHCFQNDILGNLDATGIADLIHRKEISPFEVTQAVIARVKAADKVLHGVAELNEMRALQESINPHAGFFSGIPILIKDNTDVQGFKTCHGSDAITSSAAIQNDVLVDQFLDQGFICLGKSTMPEFGLNASTEHRTASPTRNPWNINYSCGGSSGGAAAMVAAGALPIAHAKDGGGSIRIPASCTGLVGLKPSRGRLIAYKLAKKLPVNIVADGVLTRSVRDTANFYREAEHYYRNSNLPSIGLVSGAGTKRLRIAFITTSPFGDVDDAVRRTVEDTVKTLEGLGHSVEQVPLPYDIQFLEDFKVYWSMFAASLRYFGKQVMKTEFDSSGLNNLTKALSVNFLKNFYRLPTALKRLNKTPQLMAEFYQNYDALIMPVTSSTVPEIGYLDPSLSSPKTMIERLYKYVAFTPIANASGNPSISLPCGHNVLNNTPIGLQIQAPYGGEKTLLELAFELEEAQSWRKITDMTINELAIARSKQSVVEPTQ